MLTEDGIVKVEIKDVEMPIDVAKGVCIAVDENDRFVFDISELEEIADYIMVYVKHHKKECSHD